MSNAEDAPREGRVPDREDGAQEVCRAIEAATRREPFACKMGIRCLAVEPGFCRVEMTVGEDMQNLFALTHGGAVFSLIDEAFQLACNSHGVTALALNLSVTYVRASRPGDLLVAEAREVALTSRTATYSIQVTDGNGKVVATAQALAYRKGGRLPFVDGSGLSSGLTPSMGSSTGERDDPDRSGGPGMT